MRTWIDEGGLVVNTRQSRRPLPTAPSNTVGWGLDSPVDSQLEMQFAEYRSRVTALFADHRHLHPRDGVDVCTCGASWPCMKEELAAWLLDDWV
jgi:hypothetical protein